MRTRTLAATCAAATLLALGGLAVAATPAAAAPTAAVDSVTTLPLFGAQLTVDITAGPGGTLSSVALNPADGMTATTVKPNKVAFVNEDGTVKLRVSSKHGGQRVEAKAGQLADIVGRGAWAGDIFDTGTTTNVAFMVADKGDGTPDITGVTADDPTATIAPTQYKSGHGDKVHAAIASIEFTSPTQSRTLWITASVGTRGDTTVAKVAVTLSRQHGVRLPAAEVAGAQSWSGLLCDGTTATVTFNVGEDGAISAVVANPATAQVEQPEPSFVKVQFSERERVHISVKSRDGELKLNFREKIRCERVDPEVNTPIDESQAGDNPWGEGHWSGGPWKDGNWTGGGWGGDGDGSHKGDRGDRGSDDGQNDDSQKDDGQKDDDGGNGNDG